MRVLLHLKVDKVLWFRMTGPYVLHLTSWPAPLGEIDVGRKKKCFAYKNYTVYTKIVGISC